jgi:phospholipid-binding lipoprotein MlaA
MPPAQPPDTPVQDTVGRAVNLKHRCIRCCARSARRQTLVALSSVVISKRIEFRGIRIDPKSDDPMSALQSRLRRSTAVGALVLTSLVSGCAHQNVRDPLEPLNRGIYAFNDALDTAVVKPVATGYRAVLPQFVRTGVSNFFSNLDDITVIVNGILQLKIPQALSDTGRFVINTTVGVLGLIDVATHLGLEKHNEDFGQTLGYWGVGNGPYLMLPFLGPSTFRDGVGRWVDSKTDPVRWEDHIRTRNQFLLLRVVNTRANLLDSEKVLDAAAIDRYAFLRDAYLQRRRSLVYDGNPPPEPDEDFAPEPRSEVAPEPVTSLLTDRYGAIVAGAPANAASAPNAMTAATPVPPGTRAETVAVGVDEPARFVRVWLPGAAR